MRKKWNFFLDVKRFPIFTRIKKSNYFCALKRFPLFLSKSGVLSTAQRELPYLRKKGGTFLSQNWTSIFSEKKNFGSNANLPSVLKKRARNLMADRSHRKIYPIVIG